MTKGMIVEVHIQFMVDYPGTVFEGVGAYKIPRFPGYIGDSRAAGRS